MTPLRLISPQRHLTTVSLLASHLTTVTVPPSRHPSRHTTSLEIHGLCSLVLLSCLSYPIASLSLRSLHSPVHFRLNFVISALPPFRVSQPIRRFYLSIPNLPRGIRPTTPAYPTQAPTSDVRWIEASSNTAELELPRLTLRRHEASQIDP